MSVAVYPPPKELILYDPRRDQLIYVIQNLCGCHHFDLFIQFDKPRHRVCSIGFIDQKSINKYYKYKGWIKL